MEEESPPVKSEVKKLKTEIRRVHREMDSAKKKDLCLWCELCQKARELSKKIFSLESESEAL